MAPSPSIRSLALFVATLAALSCGGGSATGPDGGASLVVQMHDAPVFADATAFLVTFSDPGARRDQGDMVSMSFPDGDARRTCDLKQLEDGHNEILAVASPPEGVYNQLRIVIPNAHLNFENKTQLPACDAGGTRPGRTDQPVQIPSNVVTIDRRFEVKDGARTTITLDFDGEKSVRATQTAGVYILEPLIRVVSIEGP